MYFNRLIPDEYWIAQEIYCREELEKTPICTIGKHRGDPVVRYYSKENNYSFKEFSKKNKNFEQGMRIAKKREKLQKMNKELSALLAAKNIDTTNYRINMTLDHRWNRVFFDSLIPENNSIPNKGNLIYKGIHMRSRGEIKVAEVLDSLNLEWKYEVSIMIDDEYISTDFVVYIPAFDRCFFLEFMGRLDSPNYQSDALNKIRKYFLMNVYQGKELLMICADESSGPIDEVILSNISMILFHFCQRFLRHESSDFKSVSLAQ